MKLSFSGIRQNWRTILQVAIAIALCLPGLFQLSLQTRLWAARFRYPFDIEWLEGPALYQAYRTAHGLVTYGPPQVGYLPLMHPIGYPALLGLVGRIFGLDYSTGRTLSFAMFLFACFLVVRALLRHEEDRRRDAWILSFFAIGTAAAAVPLFEGFYDLIRDDVMAVMLAVLAAALADTRDRKMRPRRIAAIAVVLTAIAYTRLPAIFFPVWIVLFVFVRHRKTGFFLVLATATVAGLTLVALQTMSQGWYWMYTVGLYQGHHVTADRFLLGTKLVFKFAPFIIALPPAVIALAIARKLSARTVLWFGMLVAAIPAALLPFAKVGGFSNDFMPIAFLIGPGTAFVVIDGVRALARWPRVATALRYTLFAGGAVFLVLRKYDIKVYVPTPDAFKQAKDINEKIAKLDGGVIIPRAPFVPVRNHDRAQQFSDMPYLDLIWSGFPGLDLGPYLDKIHAKWAIISTTEVPISAAAIASRYQVDSAVVSPAQVIGERCVLRYLMRWKDDETNGHVLFDFEEPLVGWTQTGDAFAETPTTARPLWQNWITGVVGKGLANSYHPKLKDSAKGTLVSPPFLIDRPHMSLLVGGGWGQGTRVELQIDGRTVKRATGIFQGSETLMRQVWDVSSFQGKQAKLALIDQDAGYWGHLLVDHVVLY